ncbi:MAG: PIN domain-containing protein [Planctomycetales bacterium]
MNAVDTNVLLYARDQRDPAKQAVATEFIASLTDGVLVWQVACEYIAAGRKLEPYGFSREHALQDIQDLRRVWSTILPDWPALNRANGLMGRFSLSFWDAMLIAVCLEQGVAALYTEDFDSYRTIDGLRITNPFREGA